MKKLIITSLLIVFLFNKFGISQKVAIIGKGPGGALSSYFLHKIIPGIKIDIYDHQPKKKKWFSGTMFTSQTMYINDLIKEKNVQTVYTENCLIKDGDKFYNSDAKKLEGYESFHRELKEYITQQFEIFKQIYEYQKNGQTFRTVRELLKSLSMDFENYYASETTENLLINKNPLIAANPIIQKFLKDGLAIHFSDINAHGFTGLAFLMFSEIIEEFKQVAHEDVDLFIKSLFHEDDQIIEEDVLKIVRKNNKNYVVLKKDTPVPYDFIQIPYDFIILATTTASDIKYFGFKQPVQIFKYREAHILFMTGRLTRKFKKVSKEFISICDIKNNRIYTQFPYSNTTLFSIATLQQLSESDISQYVKQYKIKFNDPAHAPPDYSIKDDESLLNAKFELGENLYNVHALHSLILVDELLAIGAKNIALLIKDRIEEIGIFVDEKNLIGEGISSSSEVGQTTNQMFEERITSGERTSSSTVGKRTNRSRAGKSRINRSTKHLGGSKKKYQ